MTITELLAKLDINPHSVFAIGHSMGALLACGLAARAPICGVVLIGPVHPTPALAEIFASRIETVEKRRWCTLCPTYRFKAEYWQRGLRSSQTAFRQRLLGQKQAQLRGLSSAR